MAALVVVGSVCRASRGAEAQMSNGGASEAVEQAVAWLRSTTRVHRVRPWTRFAAGDAQAEITAPSGARRAAAVPAGADWRGGGDPDRRFLGTWALLSWFLVANDTGSWQIGEVASMILGAILGVIGILSLIAVFASRRLREGAEGALVAVLAIPFVLLLIVAGLCVFTTSGMTS
jgi:hypothetical protein